MRTLFVASLLLLCGGPAATPSLGAIDPPECPAGSTTVYAGTMTSSGTTITIPLNLEPCQTVGFSITTTGHQTYGASVSFKLFNSEASPRVLYELHWASYGTVNKPDLPTGPPWIYPYRGTRGVEGLPANATLRATFFTGHQLTYSVTVTKSARAGYNLGGTTFGNATTIPLNETQHGSLHQWEPGQFYRIALDPGQTISLAGQATGSPTHGTAFRVDVYDANEVFLMTLVNKTANGTETFPVSGTGPTFTPPGGQPGTADFYLKARALVWPTHDFQFEVVLQPCAVPVNLILDPNAPPTWITNSLCLNFTIDGNRATASCLTCGNAKCVRNQSVHCRARFPARRSRRTIQPRSRSTSLSQLE